MGICEELNLKEMAEVEIDKGGENLGTEPVCLLVLEVETVQK